ncbi:MAG: homoserine kinase, partial [Candidatus Puniceispirillaceae bacterium]
MAVYTNVDDAALGTFLEAYDLGTVLSFAGIAEGVENSNYLLRTDRAHYILTLYEKRVERTDLPFFIEVMEVLANSGLTCPLPVPARDGTILHELAGRPCAIFTFLDGTWSRFPNREKCAELGRTLAHMHLNCAPVTRRRPNALGPDAWRPLLESIGERADVVGDGMKMAIKDRLDTILDSWPDGLPTGVIHADLFPNNVLFIGDRLTGVIDFYFACDDILAYDLRTGDFKWKFNVI